MSDIQLDLFGDPIAKVAPFKVGPQRTRYWKSKQLAADEVYVGRPSKWGNPIVVGSKEAPDRATAVGLFRKWIVTQPDLQQSARKELKGKSLACWCPVDGGPCHADVWMEIANSKN